MACAGTAPTLHDGNTFVTHSSVSCENTIYCYIDAECGASGYTAVLYRAQGATPTFVGGNIVATITIPDGPQSLYAATHTETPPCVRGTYHYVWRIECEGAVQSTATDASADSGGAATITFAEATADADCLVTTRAQVSKPCGECAGTIKCFRKAGSPVTFDPSEEIFSDVVPAGPLIGTQFSTTDTPGDGTFYYAWRIYADTAGVDDEYSPAAIVNDCFIYDPFTTALPEGEMEKQIVLVNVTRGGDRGYEYTDYRVLNLQEQRMEWWIHKNGGCGAFRFLTHDDFPEIVSDTSEADSWEIHVRIKLAGEYNYTTWYRGIIRSVKIEEQGNEQFSDVRGYGYLELLDNVQVQKEYPAGVSVSQVVNDIMDTYISPNTRIRRPSDIDDTSSDSGVDNSPYAFSTPIHFECSAMKALKFLSEIQGSREFGVDADGLIYFRSSITNIIYNFFLSKNIVKKISGGKTFIQANEIKVAGKSFGSRDFLQVRPDVTDVSNNGVYESAMEVPWVTGDNDASRWADNIIAKNKGQQRWSVFTWKGVTRRLDASNPIGRISIYGDDISNDRETYDLAKIQYVEGGWVSPAELREMGASKINPDLDQQVLKATFYAGFYPRDLIEELEVRFREQIEFLKGRHKQYRYPHDVTNLPITGHLPGEILHYSRDVTNIDVTNNRLELQDLTNPRGLLLAWQNKQWTKLSPRRTFHVLPSRGLFIGEIVSLITDPTFFGFGVLYWWTGTAWTLMGSSGGGGGASLSTNNPTTILPDDAADPGTGTLASKDDHRHAIATDTAGATAIGDSAAEGSASSFSRSDHRHSVAGGTPVDITNANADGSAVTFARSDHRHRGVLSVQVKGQTPIYGYVDITANPPLKLSQSGSLITGAIDPVFIRKDGTIPFEANQSMGGLSLIDVTNPQTNYQVANKKYVDDLFATASGTTPVTLRYRRPLRDKSFLAVTLTDQAFGATGVTLSFTVDESQTVNIGVQGVVRTPTYYGTGNTAWDGKVGYRLVCVSLAIDETVDLPWQTFNLGSGDDNLRQFTLVGQDTRTLAAGTYTLYLHWGDIDSRTALSLMGEDDGYKSGIFVEYTNLETVLGYTSGRSSRLFNYERCL